MISENIIDNFIKELEKDQIEISKSISENSLDKDKKLKQLSKLNSLLIQLTDYKSVYISYHPPVNKVVKPPKASKKAVQ